MKKPTPTKTTNPIHFEDLDPKRFEDLVRELIYDFRDWQTIEATGKGGDDDGFDIRAYERTITTSTDDEGNEVVRPMDGNLWMVQCKREKTVPPGKIKKILKDIDPQNPPYGYILAAATNFSKVSHDVFREELTKLGVMEFYLWGSATLETELHQPKNDRVLFTFFGISNVRRRRSRATEIRSEVINKNKVMRMLGDHPSDKWILARDSKDFNYPYKSKYHDFDLLPRWKAFQVVELHPRGIIIQLERSFSFHDEAGNTFDVATPPLALQNPYDRNPESTHDREQRRKVELVRDFWERLPLSNQSTYLLNGIIRYEDMLVIDDKGDSWNEFPHIYVDFMNGSPVSGEYDYLEKGQRQISLDGFKRVGFFPSVFPEPKFGVIHDQKGLPLPSALIDQFLDFRGGDLNVLYDADGRFAHLRPNDIAVVRNGRKDDRFLQVTQKYKRSGAEILRTESHLAWAIAKQIERELTETDEIDVIEVRNCYRHQWERIASEE